MSTPVAWTPAPTDERFSAAKQEGQTRDCLDPWIFAQVASTGGVRPCCIHPPVGRLDDETSLADVLNSAPVRNLRQRLLTGAIAEPCLTCNNKRLTDVSALRRRYVDEVVLRDVHRREDGTVDLRRHPDLAERFRFEQVRLGFHGLGDRIYLHPNPAGHAPARVVLAGIDLRGARVIDLFLHLDHDGAPTVDFELTLVAASGETVAEDRTSLTGRARSQRFLEVPESIELADLAISVALAPGAHERLAHAYVDYPLVLPRSRP